MKLLPFYIGLLLFISGCYASSGGYYGGYSGSSGGESFLEKRNREYQQRYENSQRQQIIYNQQRQEQLLRQQNSNVNRGPWR